MDTCGCFCVPKTSMDKICSSVGLAFQSVCEDFKVWGCRMKWQEKRGRTAAEGWPRWVTYLIRLPCHSWKHTAVFPSHSLPAWAPFWSRLSTSASGLCPVLWALTLATEARWGPSNLDKALELWADSRRLKVAQGKWRKTASVRWRVAWGVSVLLRADSPCWDINPVGEPTCWFSKQELHLLLCSVLG